MDFHNFFFIYVFEVEKFIAVIPTELPHLDYFENSGQFLVWKVFGVLMISSYGFSQFLHYYYTTKNIINRRSA